MNNYETIMIINTKIEENEREKTISKFKDLIEQNGKITKIEDWGKRKLAYPIQKQTEGHYVLIQFESKPEFIDELNRLYNIDNEVIKHIVVKMD